MKIKSLFRFKGIKEFNTFSDYLEQINWKIDKQLLKNRVAEHKNNQFINELKRKFIEKKISIWPLKDEETITWLDTLLLMRRLMIELFKKGINTDQITILMEYPLVYGNYMRTDYLLVYERLIIVLEFGMFNQDERRSEERYTKKLQESINHRQIIANMVSKWIDVVNYVMIYKPEHDSNNNLILTENNDYNQGEIQNLIEFVIKNIRIQDNLTAIKQLESIQDYN
ncbi:MAG: hypothetical protein NUK62_02685 [Tenericutes bacterium]|jgi:hypothetical protein|nr:hypothetical protein [Mycoplasmatota bacterium]